MSNQEANNKWHFPPHAGEGNEVSLNDSSTLTFNKDVWNSLVREAIQNSLDAVDDTSVPVTVSFNFNSINPKEWPEFMKLREHMQGCIDLFTHNDDLKKYYEEKIAFLDEAWRNERLWYLEIKDTNTAGMSYFPGESRGPFYSFVLCQGNSEKPSGNHGGSFGIGKAAYFNASYLRTVIVSSMDLDGNVAFCGVVRLSTHKLAGEKLSNQGFYNVDGRTNHCKKENNELVPEQSSIPEPFRMDESGSRFCIMGLKEAIIEDGVNGLRRGVVRNFADAIGHHMLDVTISVNGDVRHVLDDTEENHISKHVSALYPDKVDTIYSMSSFNPRGYYEAVANYNPDDSECGITVFEEEIPGLNRVRLYIKNDPEGKGGIVFMRKNHMLVERVTRKRNSFFGVLVCDNEEGDRLLGMIEPPSHDSWNPKNFRNKDSDPAQYSRLKDIFRTLMEWINSKIDKVFVPDSSAQDRMDQLRDLVSMPLTEDEADRKSDAAMAAMTPDPDWNGDNPLAPTNKKVDKPNSGESSSKIGIRIFNNVKGNFEEGEGDDGGGRQHGGHPGPGPGPHPGPEPGPEPGFTPVHESPNGKKRNAKRKSNARIRVANFKKGDQTWHKILIRVDHDVDGASMTLEVASDQGKADLRIEDARINGSKATVRNNTVSGLKLSADALNEIEIKFADNLRHSIKTTLNEH